MAIKLENENNESGKYTILVSVYTYGHTSQIVEKDKVRAECERLKKALSAGTTQCYKSIEVVNNDTGEVREFWNNNDNKIQF